MKWTTDPDGYVCRVLGIKRRVVPRFYLGDGEPQWRLMEDERDCAGLGKVRDTTGQQALAMASALIAAEVRKRIAELESEARALEAVKE